jgi:hypothetical protein
MEIGRNGSCHCGSGKKYKKCCLTEKQPNQAEFKKQRWHNIHVDLIKKILNHVSKAYGPEAIHEAYNEFHLYDIETGFDPDSTELPIFMPWFFYEWYPDVENVLTDGAPDMPPAQSLAETGSGVNDDEIAYLLECCKTGFSFFEILEVIPDKALKLKNILTEEYHTVLERKATQGVQPGDIFFGKVMEIDELEFLEACAPTVIPPQFKVEIIKFRKHMGKKNKVINHELLHEWAIEVLEVYRFICDKINNPPDRILVNTDGHLLVPHKLVFEIDDPNKAFEALHPLCINHTKEELLDYAKRDRQGKVKSVDFSWLKSGNKKHKTWDNTILGNIDIKITKMVVEVNSAERAKKFQSELKKKMPSGWKLKSTLIERIESKTKNSKTAKSQSLKLEKEQAQLMANPEIKNHMEKMMKAHWDNWMIEPIPALGGAKPVDAVKSKDGREALEALLTQFERNAARNPMVGQSVQTIKDIRSKLGL